MIKRRTLPFAAAFLLVALAGCGGGAVESDIDLDAVLDSTMDSLMEIEGMTADRGTAEDVVASGEAEDGDTVELMLGFADVLERNYNAKEPALYDGEITVAPQNDASFLALADANADGEPDEGEDALWLIEIDGENARIVATDRAGAVDQAGFSGTSLLAGYFLARMLTRQRLSGADTRSIANKRTVSPPAGGARPCRLGQLLARQVGTRTTAERLRGVGSR